MICRKSPRSQGCSISFLWGAAAREGSICRPQSKSPFGIASHRKKIRSEIAAQVQRLEKFSPRITSCRVAVNGPQTRHRRGELFQVELRIAVPEHRDVVVDRRHNDALEREHPLVAIREAFDAASRQIEDIARDMRGQVKEHTAESHGRVAKAVSSGEPVYRDRQYRK